MDRLEDHGPALVFEESGEVVSIGEGGLVVGRTTECSLHVPDNTVSKRHAKVVREGRRTLVIDFGSTNGTYVNGVQVTTQALEDGDHVRFAAVSFRFRARPSIVLEQQAPDRRLTRVLELVRRLSTEILASESERNAIRLATDFVLDQLHADRVFVAFSRPNQVDLEISVARTRPDLDKRRACAPVVHTPMQRVVKCGKTYCPDAVSAAELEATSASMRAASLGAILVMPLAARGRILGAIQAERLDGTAGPFDEVDVLAGEVAANLVASCVETARLYRFAPNEALTVSRANASGAIPKPVAAR